MTNLSVEHFAGQMRDYKKQMIDASFEDTNKIFNMYKTKVINHVKKMFPKEDLAVLIKYDTIRTTEDLMLCYHDDFEGKVYRLEFKLDKPLYILPYREDVFGKIFDIAKFKFDKETFKDVVTKRMSYVKLLRENEAQYGKVTNNCKNLLQIENHYSSEDLKNFKAYQEAMQSEASKEFIHALRTGEFTKASSHL